MPTYQLTSPDGQTYRVTAPEGADENRVMEYFQSQIGQQINVEPKRDFSDAESFGRGALQGATFGFSDEIAGVATGAYDALTGGDFTESYNETVEGIRKANKQAREANPYSYLGGEVGSAFFVPGGLARVGIKGATAAANAGLKARSLAAAKEGAAYGAAFGAGHAEGGLQERAAGAGMGALTGAAVGGVLPGTVDAFSAAWRGGTGLMRALKNPERMAREKVAQALSRDFSASGQVLTPTQAIERASDKLSLQRNRNHLGLSASGRENSATRTHADQNILLADIGGENTRNLLRSANNQNSPAAQTLKQRLDHRQHFQFKRLSDDLAMALGDGRKAAETADQLIELATSQSKPLFDAAFRKDVPDTPALREMLQRPAIRRLVDLAKERALNEGRDYSQESALRVLHNVKIEIDHQIGNVRRGLVDTKSNWDIRTLVKLKNDLKKSIKVPEYHQALKAYSGPAALKNAIEEGFDDALKMPVSELRKKLSGMARDEAEGFRMGASQAIVKKIDTGNFNRDRTQSLFQTPDMQNRLGALIPSNAARRRFQRAVLLEGRFVRTRAAAQGNSTTAKQLTTGQESMQPVQDAAAVAQLALGKFTPAMQAASRYTSRALGMTPEVADRVIRELMATGGQQNLVAWRKLLARAERDPHIRASRTQKINAVLASQGIATD